MSYFVRQGAMGVCDRVRCFITITLAFIFNNTHNLNGRLTCGDFQVCVSELTLRIKISMIFYENKSESTPDKALAATPVAHDRFKDLYNATSIVTVLATLVLSTNIKCRRLSISIQTFNESTFQ